ncbi:acyltransferase family protein [Aliikangiella sp. G2MR2-5]|uniref:acyltransferase family protein n=1 Tax=Aliikangiella sp. G2MR2-5 TaxID=2788943 RepID=UPI0018AACDBE|nr:acyltransferase family protein [Aliikangiella sp. G2MR2-5]
MTHNQSITTAANLRRYDIDWLRVLAFLLLIFYHIGMFYVYDWGWHIKSAYQSEFLQNLMLLLNRWRMPLIFLISGMALSLVEAKVGPGKLLKLRFVRVFVPLVLGMYIIVPPQTYLEIVANNDFSGGYWSFYQLYIDPDTSALRKYNHGPLGLLTWNHLWYLAYLWHYTLIYLLVRPLLTRVNWVAFNQRVGAGVLFVLFSVWITLTIFWLKPDHPITHNLTSDWYNHAVSFSIFALGYLLPKCRIGWQQIILHRRKFLLGALFGYATTLIFHNGRLDVLLTEAGFDVNELASHFETFLLINSVKAMNIICWLFMLLGYAGRYLTRSNRFLSYMNEAVLPWYILHQTVTVVVAAWLAKFALGPILEPVSLIFLTFFFCALGYELLKRNNITRFIFGMKLINRSSQREAFSKSATSEV